MPSIKSVEENDVPLKGEILGKQEGFVRVTQSIRESLQVLMREVESLDSKWGNKK